MFLFIQNEWQLKSEHGLSQVIGLKYISANGSIGFKEI